MNAKLNPAAEHAFTVKHDPGLNVRYTAMQFPYWMGYSVLLTFASVFLLNRGFTNGQIGLILALANLLAALFQPFVAAFADRSKRLTLSQITILLASAVAGLTLLLILLPEIFLPTAVLYTAAATLLMVLQPLTISLGTFFILRGYPLNFGLARGAGSLSFAVISSVTGILVDRYSPNIILYLFLLVFLLFIAAVSALDTRKTGGKYSQFVNNTRPEETEEEKDPCSLAEFLRTYKKFILLLAGVSLIFVYHNILNSYLFQIMEPLGGTAADMGTSLSIAAFAELPAMFFFSWFLRHFKCKHLIQTAAVFFSLKAVLILLASRIWMINLTQLLQMMGFGLHTAASVYYTNQIIPKKDQVKGQALMTTANTIGGVLGNLLGGQLLNFFGVTATLFTGTLISCAGTLIVCLSAEDGKQ